MNVTFKRLFIIVVVMLSVYTLIVSLTHLMKTPGNAPSKIINKPTNQDEPTKTITSPPKPTSKTVSKSNFFQHYNPPFSFHRPSKLIKIKGEENPVDELEKKALSEMKKELKQDYTRQVLLRERWKKNNEWIRNRTPKIERTPQNPVIIFNGEERILGIRWSHLNLFSDEWTKDCPVSCKFTQDKKFLKDSHVILGIETEIDGFFKENKIDPTSKKFALLSLESVERYVQEVYGRIFKPDILVTTSLFSDVPVSYVYDICHKHDHTMETMKELLEKPPITGEKNEKVLISTWISNCSGAHGNTMRMNYVTSLGKFIEMHHYGKCMRNVEKVEGGRDFKLKHQAKYYFTLSAENLLESDYSSEKYFGTLMTDTVQIVLGSPTIHDISPINGKIVINADEFSPSELAKYLKELVKNKEKYNKLKDWRKKGISKNFLQYTKTDFILKGKNSWLCRICQNYHQRFD